MTKGRTLRRIRKPSKKTYLSKGGQQALDYRDKQDSYVAQIAAKKELYNIIQKESAVAYNYETTKKNNDSLTEIQNILTFINTFYDQKNTEYNELIDNIKSMIDKYGLEYKSYFIQPIKILKESLNDINNLITYATHIQTDFTSEIVHLHLIKQRLGLLTSAKEYTNIINKKIVSVNDSIKKIEELLIKEEAQKKTEREGLIIRTENKKTELSTSINTVKRDYPVSFIPNNNPYIEGCPLGTVLGEDGKCNYYNDTTLIESVPIQRNLINTETSDWVIWFNNITTTNLNDPLVFERKPLQYLMRLRQDDMKYFTEKDDTYFNIKYIVTEQNGALYKNPDGFYIFVTDVIEKPLSIPGFSKYYFDSNNLPRSVQIIDIPEEQKPILRNNLSQDKYFKALHDIDQILYGIKYVETDNNGKLLNNTVVPFYPNYDSYELNGVDYTKLSSNGIDSIIYRYKGQFEDKLDDFNMPATQAQAQAQAPAMFGGQVQTQAPLLFDTLSLDPHAYNLITNLYINKYVQMKVDKFYNPFIFPQFFLNLGDYFIIHNVGKEPIVFNTSANSEEKRVVVYPNQMCCFVFSDYSKSLRYGSLFLDRYISNQTKSSKATKYKDIYVFVENNQPLFDTEHNLISVPNLNPDTKTYYEYDDMFETTPKQISEIVDVPIATYDISQKFYSYSSPFITLTNIGVTYVFCDASGNPLLDILGYFIPVPSPIHYNNGKYIWYALEKVKEVTLLNNYDGIVNIDEQYDNTQFESPYSTTVNNISVFINSLGLPLLANRESYLGVSPIVKTEVKQVQLFLPQNFKIAMIDENASNLQIKTQMLVGLLKVYTQNTQVLENYFKDISGNMNNISSLKDELFNTVNEVQVSRDMTTLGIKEKAAKQLYEQILITKANLEKYNSDKIQRDVYNQEVNKVKETRNNDMVIISAKIQAIKDTNTALLEFIASLTTKVNSNNNLDPNSKSTLLSKLDKSSLDINTIKQSEITLEQSFNFVKDSINKSDTIENVNKRAQNINIVLKSTESLERNVAGVSQSLNELSVEITKNELELKKNQIVALVNAIAANKTDVDQNASYIASLPTDNPQINEQKKIIENSMKVIDDIAKTVDTDQKVIVTFTPEIANEQLSRYTNYINNSISLEKQNIAAAVGVIDNLKATASTTQLIAIKTELLRKIDDFKIKHTSIKTLLNNISSKISYEQKQIFESELLENLNIIQDIENNINTLTTTISAEEAIARVAEIDTLNSKIQYDLQVIELTTQAPAPAPLIQGGKKKKWPTRKQKRT